MNGNPTGKLSLTKKGAVMVEYTNKNGKSVTAAVPQDQLSKPLAQLRGAKSANLNGVQVEFEIEDGQPRNVREMGKSFEKPVASRDARSGQSRSGDRRQDGNGCAQKSGFRWLTRR